MSVRGYLSAFPEIIKQQKEELYYKVYITDALKAIAENTTRLNGGTEMTRRWIDVIEPKPEDRRSAEEIAADVVKKAGLTNREVVI